MRNSYLAGFLAVDDLEETVVLKYWTRLSL